MDIQKILNKITGYYHRDHSKLYITVRRDWNILLLSFFLLLLVSFAYNYYVYLDTVTNAKESSPESISVKNSEIEEFKKELDEIFIYFENKNQYHQNLLNKKVEFTSFISEGGEILFEQEEVIDEEGFKEDENKTSFLNVFKSGVSNTASVWKSIFVDLFK